MKDLKARARACGVQLEYRDFKGKLRQSPEPAVIAVIEALEAGLEAGGTRAPDAPLFLRRCEPLPFEGPAVVETESGSRIRIESHIPAAMPFGYHRLSAGSHPPVTLVVSPGVCHLPRELRTWGWAVQLYSIRSASSWGLGDLADLEALSRWASACGAGMLMINPIGAVLPGAAVQPSPYFPSSRTFRNPLYLSIESVPGAGDAALDTPRRRGHALNSSRLIDRDAAWQAKQEALEILFDRFEGDPAFDRFCSGREPALHDFATFCAIAEIMRVPHGQWPEILGHPQAPGVAAFRRENARRIRFHKWLQWLLEIQLAGAAKYIGLIQDLPVGIDPAGADAWIHRGAFASGFSVGAPPDEFNRRGQDWGVAPLNPATLPESGFEPFIRMVRATLAGSAAVRIDHVMGLFRLFWIPQGFEPADGVYVRYPTRELVDILAIESNRASAFVAGEDLGTVEPEVRQELAEKSILSYRVLLFEDDLRSIPQHSVAAVTTHDLPTVAGVWTGADLRAQRRLASDLPEDSMARTRTLIGRVAGVEPGAPVQAVVEKVHTRLARTAAAVVLVTLEDALGVRERPNMPGTTSGWPNWSIPLPATLEQIIGSPEIARLAEMVRRGRERPAG